MAAPTDNTSKPMIRVENLVKRYGELAAVNDISFTVNAGEIFMLLVALMFTAFGTAVASVMEDFQGFQIVMNFVVMPTFFLSGALFPLANVPRARTCSRGFSSEARGYLPGRISSVNPR